MRFSVNRIIAHTNIYNNFYLFKCQISENKRIPGKLNLYLGKLKECPLCRKDICLAGYTIITPAIVLLTRVVTSIAVQSRMWQLIDIG